MDDHPLCVCSEEISTLRSRLLPADGDELKLRQKNSCLSLKLKGGLRYDAVFRIVVPRDYPVSCVR